MRRRRGPAKNIEFVYDDVCGGEEEPGGGGGSANDFERDHSEGTEGSHRGGAGGLKRRLAGNGGERDSRGADDGGRGGSGEEDRDATPGHADEEEEDDGMDGDEDDEEEDSDESPVQPRVVPQRTTRGRRHGQLRGTDAEADASFWGHDTWQEELEDVEWYTEDEAHYADEFETDFDRPTDEEEEGEDELEEPREDAAPKRKANVYVDPRRKKTGGEGPASPTKIRQRIPWEQCRPGGAKFKQPTQAQHLAVAARTEEINKHSLSVHEEKENLKKMMSEVTVSPWRSKMEFQISWASDRLIEAEEETKAAARRAAEGLKNNEEPSEEEEERYCREMVLFVDFSDLPRSCIPEFYCQTQPPPEPETKYCSVTGKVAKYFDPLTKSYYSSREAFATLRKKYISDQHKNASKRLRVISDQLETLSTRVCL